MKKEDFNLYYKQYNEFNTFLDRFNFCIEVLKPTTCNKLGSYLNIPIPTITRIKNGETKNPNEYYLRAIAEYFEVTYEWLAISKYYPIFIDEFNLNCINDFNFKDEISKINDIKKDSLISKIKSKEDFKQISDSLPFYKDLFIKFISYLNETNYLETIENRNIDEIIGKITVNENEQAESLKKKMYMRSLAMRSKHIDVDLIHEESIKYRKKFVKPSKETKNLVKESEKK